MKNFLSKTKTSIILLIVTVLLLGSYVYIIASPVTYGMKYRNETVYEGEVFKGSLKYSPDGKVISENTNFDEPLEMYYYYKDGSYSTCWQQTTRNMKPRLPTSTQTSTRRLLRPSTHPRPMLSNRLPSEWMRTLRPTPVLALSSLQSSAVLIAFC